ncbi:hypothetical protein GCM10010265_48630 [Streptomyces griseoincarnatus]|nr:hypothetical protein GCM10010265_48630 [Streptomyces griseoincarnatus]
MARNSGSLRASSRTRVTMPAASALPGCTLRPEPCAARTFALRDRIRIPAGRTFVELLPDECPHQVAAGRRGAPYETLRRPGRPDGEAEGRAGRPGGTLGPNGVSERTSR